MRYSTCRTTRRRSARSSSGGRSNRMPALLMLCLARLMRWAIVASGTRNAFAISAVVRPPTARSVRASCEGTDREGWQHRKRSVRVSSCAASPSAGSSMAVAISSRRRRALSLRHASTRRREATVMSHDRGLSGAPVLGHWSVAASKASCTASSQASNCPCRRTREPRTCGASSRSRSSTSASVREPLRAHELAGLLEVVVELAHEPDHLDHPLLAHGCQSFLRGPERHDHVLHRFTPSIRRPPRALSPEGRSSGAVLYIRLGKIQERRTRAAVTRLYQPSGFDSSSRPGIVRGPCHARFKAFIPCASYTALAKASPRRYCCSLRSRPDSFQINSSSTLLLELRTL